jgi:DNA transformation protein and related proteins
MSASPPFVEHIRDLLTPIGALTDGKFFGGHAFKYRQVQFAMIMGSTLYFRVNNETRQRYEAERSKPFSYSTKNGVVQVRKYFSVPDELLENKEQLIEWAKQAIEAEQTA